MPEPPLLSASQISRYYHGRKVLHEIDLALHRGEVLGFLGPNGAGKSTTMNILCGVLAPHGGSVAICGHDLAREPLSAKRHLGYLPEVPPLHVDATVDEYLDFCARLRGLGNAAAADAIARAKQTCDLGDVGGRLIANLSKGYRQRVGIAQALLHEPAVVVLDEPTSGLDPNQIRMVRETVETLAKRHAVILSTHVLSEVQMLCNRVAILHHGRIAFDERIDQREDVLCVAFARAPASAALLDVAGVEDVAPVGDTRYRLRVADFDSAADAIARLAIDQDLGLRELSRDASPLEQVFVDLTCRDAMEPV